MIKAQASGESPVDLGLCHARRSLGVVCPRQGTPQNRNDAPPAGDWGALVIRTTVQLGSR